MARAGYDPAAAASVWKRFENAHGLSIFADATHLNGGARVRFLRLGAAEIAGKRAIGAPIEPDLAGVPLLASRARSHSTDPPATQAATR